MNPCSERLESLSIYLDGEASAEVVAQLEAHLPGCPGCRQALAALGGIAPALRYEELPVERPSHAPAVRDLFYQLAGATGVWMWLSTAGRVGGDLYYWFLYPLVYLWFFLGTQVRAAHWRRAQGLQELGAEGFQFAVEPFRLPWLLALGGMLALQLKGSSWSTAMSFPADLSLMALAPLAGSVLPLRWRGPAAMGGLILLYAARSLPLCGALLVVGATVTLLGRKRTVWQGYSGTKLAFDLAGLGMLGYLYALTPQNALLRLRPEGPTDMMRLVLGQSLWVVPALALAGWILLRTPLMALLELSGGRAPRLALGLWLGASGCLMLAGDSFLSGPLNHTQPWPFGPFPRVSLLALPVGLLAAWRLPSGDPPSQARRERLRSRILVSATLAVLLVAYLSLAWLRTAAELPRPSLPTLTTRSRNQPSPPWLRQHAQTWHDFGGLDGKRPEVKIWLKARAEQMRPLADKFLLDLAAHPEALGDYSDYRVAYHLTVVGMLEEVENRPRKALDLYLQAQHSFHSYPIEYLEGLLQEHPLSDGDYERVLRTFQPDSLPVQSLDAIYEGWRADLLQSHLPIFYVQAELRLGTDYFLQVRQAFLEGRDYPRADWQPRYPWAVHAIGLADDIYRNTHNYLLDTLRHRDSVRLLAALHVYRARHGAFPRQLLEVQSLVPGLRPGAYSYRVDGDKFVLVPVPSL